MRQRHFLKSRAAGLGLIAAVLLGRTPLVVAADPADRLRALAPDARAGAEGLDRELASAKRADVELRYVAAAAHTRVALRDGDNTADAARAVALLRMIFATQDMDPASPTYGSLPVSLAADSKKELDNHLPFIAAAMAPVFTDFYADRLPADFVAEARPHLKAFLGPLARFKISVDYANMYLMRCTSLLLLGETVGDAAAAADGAGQVRAWIEAVRKHGILEYDSPTYSPVQLSALLFAEAHVRDPVAKADLRRAIDYLWADLIANNLKGRDGCLGGPHSRDYDFVGGGGGVEGWYYAAGLFDRPATTATTATKIKAGQDAYNALVEGVRWPTPRVLEAAARDQERVVRTPCGDLPGQDRYAYYAAGVAIGSSSRYYSPYDKKLTAEFADPALPEISVVADVFDAPFGKVKNKDAHGYMKPRHTKEWTAAVQDKGLVLALLDVSPELMRPPATNVATDVLLPAHADALWLDGKRLSPAAPFDEPTGGDGVVVVRHGQAAVAVRLFAADGLAGRAADWHVKFDPAGPPTARLVAYHYRGTAGGFEKGPVKSGVLMLAGPADSDAAALRLGQRLRDAKVTAAFASGRWTVDAVAGDTTLSATLDCQRGDVTARSVNGKPYEPATTLRVNDTDLAAAFLDTPPLAATK